jgi:hypothetical protein
MESLELVRNDPWEDVVHFSSQFKAAPTILALDIIRAQLQTSYPMESMGHFVFDGIEHDSASVHAARLRSSHLFIIFSARNMAGYLSSKMAGSSVFAPHARVSISRS